MQTIAIVDYGMGNVRSVQKALEHVAPNDNCILTSDPKFIRDSDRIVFSRTRSNGVMHERAGGKLVN